MKKERSSFTSRIGFVLAAAGSAVGLGNIWRFPYLAAKYGGGIFLLAYIILALTFGFTLMITEIAIGRKTKLSCIGAYQRLDARFGFLGWVASLVPILITPYYCVIGGWVIKYCAEFLMGNGKAIAAESDVFFSDFIGFQQEGLLATPVLWFVLFVILTSLVVLCGVDKGVESVSRILMPILIILSIFVAFFSLTMPGAIEGLKFYLLPDFKQFSWTTILGAMGQMFYSMSLAMGIMVTYGSYMKKEDDLERSVGQIEIFDTGIAIIAGLMIIPATVAFYDGDASQINAGPGLMFITLPRVFAQMRFGGVIGTAFFLLVMFAALTSSISLMETVVSIVVDKLHWNRRVAAVVVMVAMLVLGLPSCLGYGPLATVQVLGMAFLDFFDFISNSILMPIVACLTCILIGHVVGVDMICQEILSSGKFKRRGIYVVMVRWIAPVFLIAILAFEILRNMGVIAV